jgi:hypothetical protein
MSALSFKADILGVALALHLWGRRVTCWRRFSSIGLDSHLR